MLSDTWKKFVGINSPQYCGYGRETRNLFEGYCEECFDISTRWTGRYFIYAETSAPVIADGYKDLPVFMNFDG